jgi:hypothetical protein
MSTVKRMKLHFAKMDGKFVRIKSSPLKDFGMVVLESWFFHAVPEKLSLAQQPWRMQRQQL